jgi:hypothetical protein
MKGGKVGQDIKWQTKWLGLFMKLSGTVSYTLSITFQYQEYYDTRQPSAPIVDTYQRNSHFTVDTTNLSVQFCPRNRNHTPDTWLRLDDIKSHPRFVA